MSAEVSVEDFGPGGDFPGTDHADQTGHRFSLIDGVGEHSFGSRGEVDGVDCLLVGDPVGRPFISVHNGDFVAPQIAADVDLLRGVGGDAGDLVDGLAECGRSVDADDLAVVSVLEREAGDHARMGGAGDSANYDVVEEEVVIGFLFCDFDSPVGNPSPPNGWSEAPAGIG